MCRTRGGGPPLRRAALFVFLLASSLYTWAGKSVVPTTTLAAETGNNTSGAPTFTTQTNGNIAPRNVSKLPLRELLYPGATTKLFAHFMPWFGNSNHMNVGYRSDDPAQVQKQVTDMLSRGIEGAIVNWYGPNFALENSTTFALMREAEARGGQFTFAVMEDGGALKKCATTLGCDVTQRLIDDLNYAYYNFEQSPAYLRMNGKPVVFFFGVEHYAIDWNRVRSGVLGDPVLVQRNAGAFEAAQMNGGYGWIAPETANALDPMGVGYLDYFYGKAKLNANKVVYGSSYAGFNDTLAPWGAGRVIQQQCGQTWLNTMDRAGKFYSAGSQLPFLQLVTWNDYEEGTQIETGIDNCVSVSAAMNGTRLEWTLNGAENTVAHFVVFVSVDGAGLMPLAELPVSSRSLEIGGFDLNPGSYQLYVKAVGKPTLTNKMSNAAAFTVEPVRTMTITTPFDGATVTSPVRIVATGASSYPVTATQVYVDGVLVHNAATASIDVQLPMQPGPRFVAVKGWDNAGGSFMQTMTVNVANQPPVALLAVTPLEGAAPVVVTASAAGSHDPDGTIASARIDFGDGTVVQGLSGSHTYSSAGTFTVTVTVTDNAGATATASRQVIVAVPLPLGRANRSPRNGGGSKTSTTTGGAEIQTAAPVRATRLSRSGQGGSVERLRRPSPEQ